MKYAVLVLVYAALTISCLYPFLPGEYDPLANPLATAVQVFSGACIVTILPAFFWFIQSYRYGRSQDKKHASRVRLFMRIYCVFTCVLLIPVLLIVNFGLSMLLGLIFFVLLLSVFISAFRKIKTADPGLLGSAFYPLAYGFLPLYLFLLQAIVDQPMTNWSKRKAIGNCGQMISEIETYKNTYGKYPVTLSAIWKDYKTGIRGIEKYHYTFDEDTYNLFFEQPKFFFDRFGTRELVVYNPNDNHLMLSHSSWHMNPGQRRSAQGWYASHAMDTPHWKYFWFD